MIAPFASRLSFLDPKLTSDGEDYGPIRYKAIVEERWYISKHLHTSYNDVGEITPTERSYLIEFIVRELDKERESMEKVKQQMNSRKES